jgi:hypothetical protein
MIDGPPISAALRAGHIDGTDDLGIVGRELEYFSVDQEIL